MQISRTIPVNYLDVLRSQKALAGFKHAPRMTLILNDKLANNTRLIIKAAVITQRSMRVFFHALKTEEAQNPWICFLPQGRCHNI